MPLIFIFRVRVSSKKKVLMFVTNSSHDYYQSIAYFKYMNTVFAMRGSKIISRYSPYALN